LEGRCGNEINAIENKGALALIAHHNDKLSFRAARTRAEADRNHATAAAAENRITNQFIASASDGIDMLSFGRALRTI
jgi:hypothetical protein